MNFEETPSAPTTAVLKSMIFPATLAAISPQGISFLSRVINWIRGGAKEKFSDVTGVTGKVLYIPTAIILSFTVPLLPYFLLNDVVKLLITFAALFLLDIIITAGITKEISKILGGEVDITSLLKII